MPKGAARGQKQKGTKKSSYPGSAAAAVSTPATGETALSAREVLVGVTPKSAFPIKRRCQGATRYGDPCRFWALANGDFCYWCEQAGRPRYPLLKAIGEAATNGPDRDAHKRRCQGRTVFGDQCRFWATGTGDFCLWCLGAGQSSERD